MNHTREQLEALYKQAFPQVASMIHALGGNLEVARDLFHDAVIIFLEKERGGQLEIKTSAIAYIKGITRVLWFHHFRQSRQYLSLDDTIHDIAIPEDFYNPQKEHISLLQHLKQAGHKCLQLLKAFYYEQLSMQEIASQFNYSTIRSATVQKYKCLEKVREQVKNSISHEEAA